MKMGLQTKRIRYHGKLISTKNGYVIKDLISKKELSITDILIRCINKNIQIEYTERVLE